MSYLVQSYGKGLYVAGEGHASVMPGDYRRDGSKRGLIFGHSRGGDATQLVAASSSSYKTMRALAASLMLPMLGTDAGGTDNWGNATAVTRMGQTLSYLRGSAVGASTTDPIILVAQSMGAPTVLNWARANLTSVAAVVLFIPAVNITDVHTNNRGDLTASINSAYGGTWSEAAYGATYNPATYAASLAGVPIQIWTASDDPIVIPSVVTAFAAAVGPSVEVRNLGALGHTQAAVEAVDVDQVVSFLLAALS